MSLWVSVSDTTRAWPGLRSCFQARAIRSAETSCATATMSSAGTPRRRSSVTRWSGGGQVACEELLTPGAGRVWCVVGEGGHGLRRVDVQHEHLQPPAVSQFDRALERL